MITRQDVIEHQLLPDELIDLLPETCECGGEILFTDSLIQIFCGEPKCKYKIAARLEDMAKQMKVDGFGLSTTLEIVETFGLISPYQIFRYADKMKEGWEPPIKGDGFAKKMKELRESEYRYAQMWEVVKYGNIPHMGKTANKIFGSYKTVQEAYADIEAGQVPFIAERLGVKNNESVVIANRVYNILMEYKQEIEFAVKQFYIQEKTGEVLNIAITDSVRGFNNKSEFVRYLNNRYEGKLIVTLNLSVTKDISVLISDQGFEGGKYEKALKFNNAKAAKMVENGEIQLAEIGTRSSDQDLIPKGMQIWIATSEELVKFLDTKYK